jgi:hypothetical protein
MVGTTAALIAVQGVPVLDVIVDAAVLGLAVYSLGSEAIGVMGDLVDFATKTAGAKTEADLDAAAQSLAKATATVGVDALAALLIHKGVKTLKSGEIPPPNSRVVEMVTPEGVRVKVRVPIEEPTNPNILESRALKTAAGELVEIPGNRGGAFAKWFDKLSVAELEKYWKEPEIRATIEDRLRHPGGYHEWLPVSRAPKFKSWGVSADDIMSLRNATKDVKFVNPEGRHGGKGSTSAHNEVFELIDKANSFAEYKALLRDWASRRLKGGVDSLPEGLR